MDVAALIPQIGYLTDRQIRKCLEEGYLIEKGTWNDEQIRHASYTVRLGSRVDLSRSSDSIGSNTKETRLISLTTTSEHLDVHPGDTALLYSLEILRFPTQMLGFTVARGLLFAEALCPENTYVDPGFTGSIYTTVTNVSNRVIRVSYGMPIARLYFFRLAEEVQEGYQAGSARGITQQLSSVRAVPYGSQEELRLAKDEQLRESVRRIPISGVHAAELFKRQHEQTQRAFQRIVVLAIAWPILLLVAANSEWLNTHLGEFGGKVAAIVVAGILSWAAPKVVSWFRSATD